MKEIEDRAMDIALESVVGPRKGLAERILARARRRTAPRFALVVAAACLAVAFGAVWWSGRESPVVPPGPAPVPAAAGKGAVVRTLGQLEALPASTHEVTLQDFDDAMLGALHRLASLKTLDVLACPAITDEGLRAIGGLATLEELHVRVRGTQTSLPRISDDGLAHLARLPLQRMEIDRAYDWITAAGVAHVAKIKTLTHLRLHGAAVTDDGAARLAELPALESLELLYTGIPEAAFRHFNVRSLVLAGDGIGDAALQRIATMPKLESLTVQSNLEITDAGVGALARLRELRLPSCYRVSDVGIAAVLDRAPLRVLDLSGRSAFPGDSSVDYGRITDATLERVGRSGVETFDVGHRENLTDRGLAGLAASKSLRVLNLDHCERVTEEGLKTLARVETLVELRLESCYAATDAVLAELARLPKLAVLDLGGTTMAKNSAKRDELTDAGLRHVASMPSLEWLSLRWRWNITDRGMEHLAAAPRLREVNLDELGKVTTEGLRSLARVKTLKRVRMLGVKLERKDFDALAKALPECELVVPESEFGPRPQDVVRTVGEIDALPPDTERIRGGGRFGNRELAALAARCPGLRELDVAG